MADHTVITGVEKKRYREKPRYQYHGEEFFLPSAVLLGLTS